MGRDEITHFTVALPGAADRQQPRAQEVTAQTLLDVGPDDHLHVAGFVLQRYEEHALGRPGLLAHRHDAAGRGPAPVGQVL